MIGRKSKLILCFCAFLYLILILSACSYPYQKIIDDIQIQSVIGFDRGKKGYIGTMLFSDFTKQEKNGEGVILQGEDLKAGIIIQEVGTQSPKPIEIGKLNLLLFGRELAEDGISYFVKTICRDPLIGSNMFLAVSEGRAEELLKSAQGKSSTYIYNLIEHNFRNQNVPLPNLQSFLFDYYGEGWDVSIPYLKVNSKDKIEVSGLAVFKNDKLQLILNQKETFLYKMLRGRIMKGGTVFKLHKGNQEGLAALNILYGQNKKSVTFRQSKIKIKMKMDLQGLVKDYPVWLALRENKNKLFLKNQLEMQMKEDFENLLIKFKEYQVDPLGIGDLVRTHSKNWDENEFYETAYRNVTYEIDLNIDLTRSGIGE